jgi:acyl dehydratase
MSEPAEPRAYEDVGFGDELRSFEPDVSMEKVRLFGAATGMTYWRFTDHERAKANGLPGAMVQGIMSQGILVAMIHDWAPNARIDRMDTIFRAPLLVDSKPVCNAVVTDLHDDERTVEIDLTIVNEAGETRVLGTATVGL